MRMFPLSVVLPFLTASNMDSHSTLALSASNLRATKMAPKGKKASADSKPKAGEEEREDPLQAVVRLHQRLGPVAVI